MANERLYQFPTKATPVPADIIFCGDSAAAYDEVNITISALIGAYPNLLGIGGLTLSANTFIYSNNSAALTAGAFTALAVSLVADSTISAMQTTLGYTATPTASLFSGWDANVNLSANNFIAGYATTATAAATTTLTVASKSQQFFTGITTQTVLLPVTSTLVLGQQFYIVNNSSGAVTVQSSGGNTIQAMAANTTLFVTCIAITGTTAASWYADYNFQTALTLPLSLANGGTNAGLTASNGGIVYSGASALAILAGTATAGQLLTSGASTTPAWTTTTYPLTNAINTMMYASSANVLGVITPVNSAVLISSAGGVPSWSTTLPSGIAATNMNLTTPTIGAALATSINFGGTSLSNYVEGTFTPTLTGSGANPTSISYSSNVGKYTRIGDLVYWTVNINVSALTIGAASGNLQISGLPIAAGATVTSMGSVAVGAVTFAGSFLTAAIVAGASVINIYQNTSTLNLGVLAITAISSTSVIDASGFYFTS